MTSFPVSVLLCLQYRVLLLLTAVSFLCRYLLLKTHQLSLDAFLVALKFMHVEDVDIDEVQCILANLIHMVSESWPALSRAVIW